MSALDDLVNLMPTAAPGELQAPPWGLSLVEVGIEFPDDYKAFVGVYGFGSINDYLHVIPMYEAPADLYAGFPGFLKHTVEVGANVADEDLGEPSMCFYPSDGGLVLWASDDGGNLYFWLRDGADPNLWPIVIWLRGPVEWHRFNGGMTACLLAILREEDPWPGFVLNPEPDWEHARTSPVWDYLCDWRFCP